MLASLYFLGFETIFFVLICLSIIFFLVFIPQKILSPMEIWWRIKNEDRPVAIMNDGGRGYKLWFKRLVVYYEATKNFPCSETLTIQRSWYGFPTILRFVNGAFVEEEFNGSQKYFASIVLRKTKEMLFLKNTVSMA